MRAAQDFNYKVALASGLRDLQAGRLRQAEEQFRYLVGKFPAADGGYRGLAKVQVELEDPKAALTTLRQGAAACAKATERAAAIALLKEAVTLDPLDVASHRHLAATLALAGQGGAAIDEYRRYADAAMAAGQPERARLEVAYAVERLPADDALRELGGRFGVTGREAAMAPASEMRGAATATLEIESDEAEPAAAATASAAVVGHAPAAEAPGDEERAALLIGTRDPSAAQAALAAARVHLEQGRTDAASDLLLQVIAAGFADHGAQRMLVDVVRTMGRPDVARVKCKLLAQKLRLEGHEDLAGELELLAQSV